MSGKITIFVTKYVLTGGIEDFPGVVTENGYASILRADTGDKYYWGLHLNKRDYALTREDAIQQAEAKRTEKIVSLEKQIAKLRKISFAAAA